MSCSCIDSQRAAEAAVARFSILVHTHAPEHEFTLPGSRLL